MTTKEDWEFRAEYLTSAANCFDRRAEELKVDAAYYRALAEKVRANSRPFFECPDCGKDIADEVEPHAAECERSAVIEPALDRW